MVRENTIYSEEKLKNTFIYRTENTYLVIRENILLGLISSVNMKH